MKTLNELFSGLINFIKGGKLATAFAKMTSIFKKPEKKDDGRRTFNVPTPQSKPRKKVGGSNNHNQSRPKNLVLMAAHSNAINRRRCHRWKH